MKNTSIKICNETIHPGERLSLALPLPELFSCAPMYMPIKVMHGKTAGPTVLIIAAMYGDELNGTEIINRLLNLTTLKKLRGTLITIPVLNVYGFIHRSRYSPDLPRETELDRSFPGSQTGTHASRLAYTLTTEIIDQTDFCINLRTGYLNHSNLPQVYIKGNDEQANVLAQTFGAPVIAQASIEKGSLLALLSKKGIPLLTYEAGEAMRFDEHAIKVGLTGIVSVLRNLDMLPESKHKSSRKGKTFFAEKNIWLRSPISGMSHSKLKLGQYVKQGEKLCTIKDPFGARENVTIAAPEKGLIVGKNNLPLVHEGESLFQLAIFKKMQQAADHLENWQLINKEKSKEIE